LIEGSCNRALGAIEDLGDGDLGKVKRLLLKRHARRCGGCSAYLSRMEAVIEALAALGRVSAPEDLFEAVMACLLTTVATDAGHLEAEVHGRRNMLLVAGAAGVGVAVAVTLAVMRWVLGRQEEESLAPIVTA
jgi:hypothetical protein